MCTFRARHSPESGPGNSSQFQRSVGLAEQWGIAKELWERPWSVLSVGEAQRLSLAIAHGLNRAEILMLDGAYIVIATLCFFCSLYFFFFSRFVNIVVHPPPRGYKEPTSGLDVTSSKAVEDTLLDEIRDDSKALKAIIWITHSEEQAERVGTRFLQLTRKGIEELPRSEP